MDLVGRRAERRAPVDAGMAAAAAQGGGVLARDGRGPAAPSPPPVARRPAGGGRRADPDPKARRQARILELIAASPIDTQDVLAARLQASGCSATQATVSRDIRDLRLVKVPTGDGRYRYAAAPEDQDAVSERMLRLFRECVVGLDASENVVVIQTLPATAAGVAEAIDGMRAREVIGTLAGERTVFVVVKPRRAVAGFVERMRLLLSQRDG